jgi:hypothetical protein
VRTLIALCWLSVSCLSVLGSASVAAADFARSQGIAMHMLPKQVADWGGKRWGFTVDFSPVLQPEEAQPVLQATTSFSPLFGSRRMTYEKTESVL